MLSSRVLVAALVASAARAVSGAARCPQADRDAPSVKTLLAAPNDTVNTAWILQPDCKLEILALEPAEDNGAATLNVTDRGIARLESLPSAVERIHLEFNEVKEGDFSSYKSLSHIILAWNNLKTADHFKFPSSLRILDLDSNELTGIAKGVVPDQVETMFIAVNKLDSLANFSLPSSVTALQMQDNAFTSLASLLPDGLIELHMDSSKKLKAIENATMPSSLTTLTCTDCALQTFRGVQLSAKLTTMDFTGVTLTELEIRESDVSILKSVEFTGDIDQTSCKTSGAALRQVKPTVAACVISDATFEAMYKNGQSQPTVTPASGSKSSDASKTTTPTSDPASSGSFDPSSSSSSTTVIIIIIVVVACVVCAVAGFFLYRKRARGKNNELDSDNKYHDAITVEAGGSSAPTVATGSSHVSHSSEYLSNDIRNDEALIAYRIAYEDVQILHVIGKGGFGVVHLGKFRGRKVAVKQMLPDRAKDMRVVRSFMDEIRLCASLEHPRIVEFIGLRWSTLQDIAVVNEYMEGGDLHSVLRKHQISDPADWFEASATLKPKSALALDVVVALVYLHSFEQPIIHRDLKTRNVLLNSEGDAKLSDFGTSREALLDETMTGEIGTLAWIAPEVLRGERYSEKADIYSLGVLLVELDTASHPYRNPGSTQNGSPISNTRIAMMVSAGKLVPSPSPDCPPDVAAVISSCLTFDQSERPSAMTVHYELRKLFKSHSASGIV